MTFSQLFNDPKIPKQVKPECNCSHALTNEEILSTANKQLQDHNHQMGAFIYTCVIVLLFASSIVYFMMRRICFQDRLKHDHRISRRRSSIFTGRGPNQIRVKSSDSGDVIIDFESLVRANERALRSKFKRDLCHHLNEIGHITYNPEKIPLPTPPTPVPTELGPLDEEMSRTLTVSSISESSDTPNAVIRGSQKSNMEAPKFVFDEDSINCYP